MPLPYSDEYNKYIKGQEDKSINIGEYSYSQLDNLFRTDIDAQYGIVRVIKDSTIVRDATEAKDVIGPDTPLRVEANNALLRALGRLRGIDFVLQKQEGLHNVYKKLREKLKTDFTTLVGKIYAAQNQQSIDNLERDFNTQTLCNVLRQANLDEGCSKSKDYEKLLFHYRNLAALIDPAQSLVTISYDAVNKVLHRITQDPITTKLDEQKAAIKKDMEKTILFPTQEEKTFQTKQLMAMQVANRHFAELAADDKRMLGAQTRKTHLHGIKNAFFVKNELIFDVETEKLNKRDTLLLAELENTQCFVRSATPVYVGGGETDERIQESTRANIEQVRQFIRAKNELTNRPKIHFTCLVTDSPMEKQHVMVDHTYRATRHNKDNKDDVSYMPCNWDGTHRRLDLSTMLSKDDKQPSVHPTPSNQAVRYRRAAQVSVNIRGKTEENIFELVACASGQDRTETESEYATQQWIRARYSEKDIKTTGKGDIVEQTRAKSRNSAEINAHIVGGSRGCKPDSRGKTAIINYDNLYSRETDEAMYLSSASTNKKNKVDKNALKAIMKENSSMAEEAYQVAHEYFRQAIIKQSSDTLKTAGNAVLAKINEAKEKIKPQDIGTLIRVMHDTALVIQNPLDHQKTARLGAMSKRLSKKPVFKKVGGALLALFGAALFVAGIVFAIPSGGLTLLASILGAKIIAVSATAAALGGAATAVIGAGAAYYGGKKVIKSNTRHDIEKRYSLFSKVKKVVDIAETQQQQNKQSKPG